MRSSRLFTRSLFATVLLPFMALLAFAALGQNEAIAQRSVNQPAATILPVAGNPLVNFKNPQSLRFNYKGAAEAVAALQGGVNPRSLASADFSADGAVDVVAGYSTAGGGVLTVLRANPDAFAPKDSTLFKKAMQGKVPAIFLPEATVYSLPESPDLLLTGDFNHDGHKDVLVASRGGNLYFLAGDGKGNLKDAEIVPLNGKVRAIAATASGHVAVSIDAPSGPELQILAPGSNGLVSGRTFPLPALGDSIAWGDLGSRMDVAVAAGNKLVVVYSALTDEAFPETTELPFKAVALTLGDFIWDREGRTEISVLTEDGTIHILQHGTLDTRPLTAGEIPGRRAAMIAMRRQSNNPTSLGAWTVASQLPYSGPARRGSVLPNAFTSPHLATSSTNDLMVLDATRNRLNILDTSGRTENNSAIVSFAGAPVAALSLPQKIDSSRETLVLVEGQAAPLTITRNATLTFNVNTTADIDSVGACATSSSVTNSGGTLSLREAVCEANNNGAGNYTINVPAGTYSLTISTFGGNGSASSSGELQVGFASGANITISGAGAGSTIIQQTDGVDRVIEQDELGITGIPLTIQNLTITGGNCSTGLDCGFSGGGVLAGFYSGDSLTLTSVTIANNTEANLADGGNQGGGVSMAGPTFMITNSTFSGNSVAADSTHAGVGGGVEFLDDAPGSLTVTNSAFTGNSVTASAIGSEGGGIWISFSTAGDTATITGSTFTGNQVGGSNGKGGGIYTAGPTTVSNSRITGNIAAGGGTGFWEEGDGPPLIGAATVTDNWWGCNAGPGAAGCDSAAASNISGDDASVNSTPWLVLSISANPTSVQVGGNTSSLTASITHNSNGTAGFTVPNGVPVSFGATLGADNPTSSTLSSGVATSTFTSGSTPGSGSASATVDNQTVSVTINVTGVAPSFTSTNNTSVTAGTLLFFSVTTSGNPTAAISVSGLLPVGVTFIDNGNGTGLLSGSPTIAGAYSLTFTASNGVLPNATQSFILTVLPSAAASLLVSAPSTAVAGTPFSFTATALDPFGNFATSYSGTVTFSSTDPKATLPASSTLINGTGTFSATLLTQGAQTITSTDSVSTSITGTSGPITVMLANLVVNTVNDDAALASNCTAQTTPGINSTDSACSLRDALANATATGAANISFASSVFGTPQTIMLTNGTLNIPSNTTISAPTTGSGISLSNLVTVKGNGTTSILTVNSGVTNASISGFSINGGSSSTAGGGISNSGTLTVSNSTISNNAGNTGGGGIYNAGTLTVISSTISGNVATGDGGGINSNGGTLTLENTTVSGNTDFSNGGGLFLNSTTTTFVNSTISGNSATCGDGIYDVSSTLNFANTILSGNNRGAGECGDLFNDLGTVNDNGGNQISTGTALGPLASYGGPTQTMLPLPGSLAICGGTIANATGLSTDQRGLPRTTTYSTACVDSGAVQTNYTAVQFSSASYSGAINTPVSPAPVVSVTESGQNIAGVPVTLGFSGFGIATGLGPVTTVAGTGASFTNLQVNTPAASDTLSISLPITAATNTVQPTPLTASASLSITGQIASTLTLGSSALTSPSGASVTFTATASGAGAAPTGSVSFFAGSTSLGTSMLSSGVATLSINTLTMGSYTITANYSGDSEYFASNSNAITEVITKGLPTVSLSPASNPISVSQTDLITATVSTTIPGVTPTGTVNFYLDRVSLGVFPLVNGVATYTVGNLTGGIHIFGSQYNGDKNYTGAIATPITIAVSKTTTAFTVSPSSNPLALGSSVTITATLAATLNGIKPTGTANFYVDHTSLGLFPVVNGVATLTETNFPLGIHVIGIQYNGDSYYTGGLSTPLYVTVIKATTTATVSSSLNPALVGTAITFTANVATIIAATPPTGTVNFYCGNILIGQGTLSASQATLTLSTLPNNNGVITVRYLGDGNYYPATSAGFTQVVNKANTTVTLSPSSNPITAGSTLTITATVATTLSGATPTGNITFYVDKAAVGLIPLVNGVATYTESTLPAGKHIFGSQYNGDKNYNGKGANPLTVTVE